MVLRQIEYSLEMVIKISIPVPKWYAKQTAFRHPLFASLLNVKIRL